ncbi:MAG: protein kinase [Pirellulales bacterium]
MKPSLASDVREADAVECDALVEQFVEAWRTGARPSAADWLAQYPDLRENRSLLLDIALEEFHQRQMAGEDTDSAAICRQFPEHAGEIGRLLSIHRLMQNNPAMFPHAAQPHWPSVGEEFQGCRLLAEMGRGAFSRVFLAQEAALGNRHVVVKVTQLGSAEALLQGKLDHPGIAPIHSVKPDSAHQLVALIMPYRGHATLTDLIDRIAAMQSVPVDDQIIREVARSAPPLNVPPGGHARGPDRRRPFIDGVLELTAQLAEALAYIHRAGIRHQDIKPSNVLLDTGGRPLLLDFNLAYDAHDQFSRQGGTLPYMAPERLAQLVSKNATAVDSADPRSDIYSLGVILYETLTGRHPFDVHSILDKKCTLAEAGTELMARQRGGLKSLVLSLPEADAQLDRLIQECLAWDADRRPASVEVVARELRKLSQPVFRGRRWLRGNRRSVRLLGIGLACCILAGVLALASRPSWFDREFRRGAAELAAGRPEVAEIHFANAHQADSRAIDATVGWAVALQRQGKYEAAAKAYLTSQPRDMRCFLGAGYCANQRKLFDEAIDCYQRAQRLGCDSPAMWNNLGFSYQRNSRNAQAAECFAQAIKLDQSSSAPFANRAINGLAEAVNEQRPLDPRAYQDIQRAIELDPKAAELHLFAARLLCYGGSPNEAARTKALNHVEKAIDLSADPKRLLEDEFLRPLQQEPRFTQSAARVRRSQPEATPLRLIDPLAQARM